MNRVTRAITRVGVSAIAVGLLGLTQLAGAAPASASTNTGAAILTPLGNGICDAGEFCVYRDVNRTGPVYDWNEGVDDLNYSGQSFPIVGGRVNQEVSSVWNRTNCTYRVFQTRDFNNAGTQVGPGAAVNLGDTLVGNDDASSHNACV